MMSGWLFKTITLRHNRVHQFGRFPFANRFSGMARQSLSIDFPEEQGTRYQPLVFVALAMATGVVADRLLPLSIPFWTIALVISAGLWSYSFRRRNSFFSLLTSLLAIACLGAGWHNVNWHRIPVNDIYRYGELVARPVFLHGTIETNPNWVVQGDPKDVLGNASETRTRFTYSANAIRNGGELVPVSGRIEVFVNGELHGFVAGDRVSIAGNFSRINSPGNPGSFDFRNHFRGQGIDCWMSVTNVEAITLLNESKSTFYSTGGRLKANLNGLIWQYVSPQQAGLASAMLLGNRDQLDFEGHEQFMVTGTVHLLSISGLHVAILAGMFLALGRTGLVPRGIGLLATAAFVVGYAWLVEFRPPVVRAGILICLYCYCKWVGRESFSFNSLAFAALIVMVQNPSELFSSGTQLSFLAVGSLIFGRQWMVWPTSDDPIDVLIARSRPWYIKFAASFGRSIFTSLMVSTVIWAFAFPLVAARFHLASPIGLIVNPLVLLPVTVALVSGFMVLIFGGWLPPVAILAGKICDLSLGFLTSIIEMGESVPWGYVWTFGPTPGALLIFYTVLIGLFALRPDGIPLKPAAALFLVWLVAACWIPSLIDQYQDRHRTTLICTMVDVGHGNCVLLELPGGKNILYDCGSIGSLRNAARNASGVFWNRRIKRLDAVIISHADSDHFNGLPEISRKFAIDRIIVSNKMLARQNRTDVAWLLRAFDENAIVSESVSAGDELVFHNDVTMQVIGPADNMETKSDNEESIVLVIQFAGRRILLTADIEGTPLDALFESVNPSAFDLAMVPHHGSVNSRPDEFLEWARPGLAVVSCRRSVNEGVGKNLPADKAAATQVLHTGRDGAVRFTIDVDGSTTVESFRHNPW